jgi:CRP-like cAMP-binding protein
LFVPPGNQLFAAFPHEYERLLPYLEPTSLVFKAAVYEPGQAINHVYFPITGVLSLICPLEGKELGVEVGVVGREGMAGLAVFLGMESMPLHCIVQVPGDALRMRADDFRAQIGRECPLHGLLLRYTHAFLSQVSLALACNSLYPVEKRFCRWLLMMHARVGSDQFPLTHEFLAAMLGVRRASVTEVARRLRRAGLIRYDRGQITVLDRNGLEASACDCHRRAQAEMDRLHV